MLNPLLLPDIVPLMILLSNNLIGYGVEKKAYTAGLSQSEIERIECL